jgi:16S rRNA processing protein RimM
VVALVRGVHGLHGAVRVEVLTDHPETRFVPGAILYPEGGSGPLTIVSADAIVDGPGWRLRFREIGSRDAADRLRGAYLEAVVLPELELERGAYYWHEIVGVSVRGLDGTDLGTIKDIYRVGETEVFVVDGGTVAPFDLPAVRAFIRVFAPRRGEIVVDAEALDLKPASTRAADPARPKAPRRTTPHRKRSAAAGSAGSEADAAGSETPDGEAAGDTEPPPADEP